MQDFLKQSYFGNTIYDYAVALGIFILGIIVLTIFKRIVLSRLKKWSANTKTTLDDFLIKGVERSILPVLYLIIFYFAIKTLTLPETVNKVIDVTAVILTTFFVIRVITSTLKYTLSAYVKKKTPEEEDAERRLKQIRGITLILSFTIYVVGFVFLLDNLGFEISAVIAGLGIGGIAIALAAQAILGDLFSYFVIFFDRPFEIGDFIVIGNYKGNIEYIGIKTTRIRSLGGEQIIVSNTDLTNSRIQNFKRMERRRIVFKIGVVYQTPAAKLAEIPNLVRNIIEAQPDIAFDRGHFQNFANSSLDFEFVYFVLSPDYNKYMDIQQDINLKIYNEFEKREIEFAYPTQTLFVNKENGIADKNEKTKGISPKESN
ncbi:MAG TPA: mechanosensitive ion channel family protein [Ignavibacteriaceae bacterium]|nr:mechanosensitive ion channel family protein [Ignavibacteriaceae bacterium]